MAIGRIFANDNFNCSYLPMTGDPEFTEECVKLAYGFNPKTGLLIGGIPLSRVARTQTLSGTGGINLAYTFAAEMYSNFKKEVYTPNATWPIHKTMAKVMGFNV